MPRIEKDLERVRVVELEKPLDSPGENEDTAELDLRPEFCHYQDEGCELAQSCLQCVFPRCVLDKPRGRFKWVKSLRDREIVRLYTAKKKNIRELAARFKICRRTVFRVLATGRQEKVESLGRRRARHD